MAVVDRSWWHVGGWESLLIFYPAYPQPYLVGTFLDEYGLLEWSLLHYARALGICGPRDHYKGLLLRLYTFTPTVLSHNDADPDSAIQISERLEVSRQLIGHAFIPKISSLCLVLRDLNVMSAFHTGDVAKDQDAAAGWYGFFFSLLMCARPLHEPF